MSRPSWIAVPCALVISLAVGAPLSAQEEYVYFVAVKFGDPDTKNVLQTDQTGFRIRLPNFSGIVTALHGVLPADAEFTVYTAKGRSFTKPLKLTRVDVDHDLAFLTSPEFDGLDNEGLDVAKDVNWKAMKGQELRVIGHPLSVGFRRLPKAGPVVASPITEVVRARGGIDDPLVTLENLFDEKRRDIYGKRRSPRLDLLVLSLQGKIEHGHSGAPVLDSKNRVVGIADGALPGTTIGWAVPWTDFDWKKAEGNRDLETLRKLEPASDLAQFAYSHEEMVERIRRMEEEQRKYQEDMTRRYKLLNGRLDKIEDASRAEIREIIDEAQRLPTQVPESDRSLPEVQNTLSDADRLVRQMRLAGPDAGAVPVFARELRLLQARLALARKDYRHAADLVRDADLRQLEREATTPETVQSFLRALLVRADSLYKLNHYQEALPFYERVRLWQPLNSHAARRVADCQLNAGRLDAADTSYSSFIDACDHAIEQGHREFLPLKASALTSRGILRARQRRYDPADADLTRAYEAYGTLSRQPRGESWLANVAYVLVLRGALRAENGQLDKGKQDVDDAITRYERLLEQPGSRLTLQVAWARRTRARAVLLRLSNYPGALADCDKALEEIQSISTRFDQWEVRPQLAAAHTDRGYVLADQDHFGGALEEYKLAARIYRQAVDLDSGLDWQAYYASSLIDVGDTYAAQSKFATALEQYREAGDIVDRLLEDPLRSHFKNLRASVLKAEAGVFETQGKLARARDRYDQVIGIYEQLSTKESEQHFSSLWANALVGRARVRGRLAQYAGALEDIDKAIATFKGLSRGGNRVHGRNLAGALGQRGWILYKKGDLEPSLRDYNASASQFDALLTSDSQRSLVLERDRNLIDRAAVLTGLGQTGAAVADLNGIVDRLKEFISTDATADLNQDYALTLRSRGSAKTGDWDFQGAIADYNEALTVLEKLIADGRTELREAKAFTLNRRGYVFVQAHNFAGAEQDTKAAVRLYENLTQGGSRPDLMSELGDALSTQGSALYQAHDLLNAKKAIEQAIQVQRDLVQGGRTDVEAGLLWSRRVYGDVLAGLEQIDDSVREYTAVIKGYQKPARGEDTGTWQNRQADALRSRAKSLLKAGKPGPARCDCDAALKILDKITLPRPSELKKARAHTLKVRADTWSSGPGDPEAEKDFAMALEILEALEAAGEEQIPEEIAGVKTARGHHRLQDGLKGGPTRPRLLGDALADFRDCTTIYEKLVKGGRVDLIGDLASDWAAAALVLVMQKDPDPDEAWKEAVKATDLYQRAINQHHLKGERPKLATLYALRALIRAKQGNPGEAVKEFDRAIALYEELVNEGRTEFRETIKRLAPQRENLTGK
jgi:tetratricopeptide (TPR) repeat protein